MANDLKIFLSEAIKRPAQIVALSPSSVGFSRMMTVGVEDVDGPIVEIGAGTGSFTRQILARGVAPERLILMEINERFCEKLQIEFPGATVLNRPAQEIDRLGLENVGAVISGVPVLARPQIQREVVGRAFDVMGRNGFFTQLTYSPRAPISPEVQAELGIRAEKRGTVWANLPPGRVFVFRRIQH